MISITSSRDLTVLMPFFSAGQAPLSEMYSAIFSFVWSSLRSFFSRAAFALDAHETPRSVCLKCSVSRPAASRSFRGLSNQLS